MRIVWSNVSSISPSSERNEEKPFADAQANVLYRQCEFGYIIMTCIINDHSRAVPEGVWVQGGGIEIPCLYDVEIQEEVSRDVGKCLKENLKSLRANADGSAERRLQK